MVCEISKSFVSCLGDDDFCEVMCLKIDEDLTREDCIVKMILSWFSCEALVMDG